MMLFDSNQPPQRYLPEKECTEHMKRRECYLSLCVWLERSSTFWISGENDVLSCWNSARILDKYTSFVQHNSVRIFGTQFQLSYKDCL